MAHLRGQGEEALGRGCPVAGGGFLVLMKPHPLYWNWLNGLKPLSRALAWGLERRNWARESPKGAGDRWGL